MDIFNTLAFITKPDHVELPAEATLEAIETLTNFSFDLATTEGASHAAPSIATVLGIVSMTN